MMEDSGRDSRLSQQAAEPVARLGPSGFDPARCHPLALAESLIGAADEMEGWGAGLEAALVRKAVVKLEQMYDALATIEDVWTLPTPEHPPEQKWHCQHDEWLHAAREVARRAIAMEAQEKAR